ncbi:hypothetical protein DFH07DRAFT_936033 [Mycena maculata]|uniref:Uncharacterized protein n=1 Tax=Mycena maculata TaxID=230809 RepID=A0AAD7NXP4_9AGAR|nr:hypothetical protein DFH07DRAFT_936033 [Mycena maculata]
MRPRQCGSALVDIPTKCGYALNFVAIRANGEAKGSNRKATVPSNSRQAHREFPFDCGSLWMHFVSRSLWTGSSAVLFISRLLEKFESNLMLEATPQRSHGILNLRAQDAGYPKADNPEQAAALFTIITVAMMGFLLTRTEQPPYTAGDVRPASCPTLYKAGSSLHSWFTTVHISANQSLPTSITSDTVHQPTSVTYSPPIAMSDDAPNSATSTTATDAASSPPIAMSADAPYSAASATATDVARLPPINIAGDGSSNSVTCATATSLAHPLDQIYPCTPSNRGRYDSPGLYGVGGSERSSFTTLAGPRPRVSSPDRIPIGWLSYIHPEGQVYFCRAGVGSSLQVLTESWVPDDLEKLVPFILTIEDRFAKLNIPSHDTIEFYYLVDHIMRTIFWVDDRPSEDVGLGLALSAVHHDTQLEELYWLHVEHFPMHFGPDGLLNGQEQLDKLVCVLLHARADQATSSVSTFPYTAAECGEFIEVLRGSKDHITDGHIIFVYSRIWSIVVHTRFLNFYGQKHARLSRTQVVEHDPAVKYRWISTMASLLSFHLSSRYLFLLDNVFTDQLVVRSQWNLFIVGCMKDWTDASHGATMGLLLHILFVHLALDPRLAGLSAVLFGASFATAKTLIHCYGPLESSSAVEANGYLTEIYSPNFKFQFVALAFALPSALQIWGLLVVLVNFGILFAHHFGHVPLIVASAASGFDRTLRLRIRSRDRNVCPAYQA